MCTVKYDKVIPMFSLLRLYIVEEAVFELLSALLCLAAVRHDSRLSSVRRLRKFPVSMIFALHVFRCLNHYYVP